jgi:hypothetical protein
MHWFVALAAVGQFSTASNLHLGVDVNLVPVAGPGFGVGGSGRWKSFGFGLYASSQRISGLAQRVSFEAVSGATTHLKLLISARFRYHPLETLTGPYLALDVGAEEWSVSSGGASASIVNGLVTPKLGFQWFPFEPGGSVRNGRGFWLGASLGAIFIIVPERFRQLPDGSSARLREVIVNPELFVGWWW